MIGSIVQILVEYGKFEGFAQVCRKLAKGAAEIAKGRDKNEKVN